MKIHACWLDPHCRKYAPAFTYFDFKKFSIRINPIYDRQIKQFGFSPWSWRIIQILKR